MATRSASRQRARSAAKSRTGGNAGVWFAVHINLFALGLSTLWTTLNTVVLPDRIDAVAPAAVRGSALGLVTFLGIGLAAVVQPFAGQVSDRSTLPDRRKPFIIAPTLLATLAVLALWWAPVFALLLAAYLLLQLLMNVAQAAFQGLIPDLVPGRQRGTASGVKTAFGAAGTAVGLLAAATASLLGYGNGVILVILCGVLALTALSVLWGVPRVPPLEDGERDGRSWASVSPLGLARALREAPPGFNRAVLTRFLFLLSLYPLQRFFLFYLEDRFGIEDPAGLVATFILGGIVAGAVAAAIGGALSDNLGKGRVEQIGIVISLFGLAGLIFAFSIWTVAIAGGVVLIGAGAFQAANWAALSDTLPDERGAEYLGLANIATAGASALVGVLGPVVDVLNAYLPAGTYAVVFTIAALCAIASFFPTLHQQEASTNGTSTKRPARA